jgi:hypothetical protein
MIRDDYTEADIEQELAVIVAQLAYVYQLQGKTDQAVELYQSIVKSRYLNPFNITIQSLLLLYSSIAPSALLIL